MKITIDLVENSFGEKTLGLTTFESSKLGFTQLVTVICTANSMDELSVRLVAIYPKPLRQVYAMTESAYHDLLASDDLTAIPYAYNFRHHKIVMTEAAMAFILQASQADEPVVVKPPEQPAKVEEAVAPVDPPKVYRAEKAPEAFMPDDSNVVKKADVEQFAESIQLDNFEDFDEEDDDEDHEASDPSVFGGVVSEEPDHDVEEEQTPFLPGIVSQWEEEETEEETPTEEPPYEEVVNQPMPAIEQPTHNGKLTKGRLSVLGGKSASLKNVDEVSKRQALIDSLDTMSKEEIASLLRSLNIPYGFAQKAPNDGVARAMAKKRLEAHNFD